MKRCSKQILAAVMCAAVLTVSAPITTYADSTLDHLNGQYSELEKQQQALKDKLNQTKTEKEKQEAIRNNLNNQITNTQKQITLLDNKINYLQNDIADKEERINELSAEVLEQQDLFMKRIRSIYKTSVGTSMLGMVFGVDSLGSYLSYGKYLSRISEHDSALLQALADNITELRTLQAQMQEEKEDLADTKVTAEGKKASLTSQKTEVESTLQDIKKMEQEYLADQAAIQKEMKQIQADIDAIYAANAGNGSQVDYSTTGFIYPVSPKKTIFWISFHIFPIYTHFSINVHIIGITVNSHKIILNKLSILYIIPGVPTFRPSICGAALFILLNSIFIKIIKVSSVNNRIISEH